MNEMFEYLKEKEEYFYPEEEKEEQEDAIEELEAEDDYGLDFVDDEKFYADHIAVKKIPDNSDLALDPEEFLKPNSDIQKFYAKGSGIDLANNQDLYEVIKLVKDMTDKHLYMKDMTWKVDIAHRKATFSFKLGDDDSKDDVDDFFLNGIQQYVSLEMFKKFGPMYKIDTNFLKNVAGHRIMKLTVEKLEDVERKDMRNIVMRAPDSASFITKTSVSRM